MRPSKEMCSVQTDNRQFWMHEECFANDSECTSLVYAFQYAIVVVVMNYIIITNF